MTSQEVADLVRAQIGDQLVTVNKHSINLMGALVPPQRIQVIARILEGGRFQDELVDAWLVGQENAKDGYRIVMREVEPIFGLASRGFPSDSHLVLVGWYGDLIDAFLSM